jgi:hypothetical protein
MRSLGASASGLRQPGHCQSKFYTACSRTTAGRSFSVFCSRIIAALSRIRRRKSPILICLDGVDVARPASGSMKSGAKMVVVETTPEGATSVEKSIINLASVTTVGLDLAKHAFQVHCIDASGRVVVAKAIRRNMLTRGRNRPLPEPVPVSALRVTVADAELWRLRNG